MNRQTALAAKNQIVQTNCSVSRARVLNDRGGESRREGVDFESALTSTPDISLHRTATRWGQQRTSAMLRGVVRERIAMRG